jgi:Fe-S-cluster-containing hydrogenase component 2
MKSNIPFFHTKLCTGCLLCEMTCSLAQKDECCRDSSFIKVFIHPYLSTPMVALAMDCNCPDGSEKCTEICNQKALKFVPREESTGMLTDRDWFPCPLI